MPHRSLEAGRKATAKHYAANKEYYMQRNRERASRWRAIIAERKNVPCMDCKRSYPSYVMDYDHRIPAEKKFDVSNYVKVSSEKMLLAEIAKCDVVCSNCHRERTYSRLTSTIKDATIV